jgi:hypothetical protein
VRAPNESSTAREFHQQWNGGAPIVDEAEKHRFTEAFVSQVLARKDPRWGRKSRAAGAGPVSKDTVAYWLGDAIPSEPTDGQIDARDLLTSSGADSWNSDDDPAYNNIYARWYPLAVAPAQGLAAPTAVHAEQPVAVPGSLAPDPRMQQLLADLETRLRDGFEEALSRINLDLKNFLEALAATTAGAVNEQVDKRFAELQASLTSALAALPKEYELRSLGRVIGTLTPKED